MLLTATLISDLEYQEIPYAFSGGLAVLVLLNGPSFSLSNILIIASFAIFIKLLEKYYYNREIFGGADILLFLIFSVVFPADKFFLFFYLSFVLGLLVVPFIWLKTRSLQIMIPFAPLIIFAYWLTNSWGNSMTKFYWRLFGV